MSTSLPLLITAHKRPKSFLAVVEAVLEYGPSKLYISIDGARNKDELGLVQECIQIAIDVQKNNSNVLLNINDANKGCRSAMRLAIDWFFQAEEKGIVLEEDCLPHSDFFRFCEETLVAFESNKKVMGITGDNSSLIKTSPSFCHGFCRQSLVWGWASWRDRWSQYRPNFEGWDEAQDQISWVSEHERKYYTTIFNKMITTGKPDSWAYPLSYTVLANDGLWVFPRNNLIKNVGFDSNATHTKNPYDPRAGFPTVGLPNFKINLEGDHRITNQYNCSKSLIGGQKGISFHLRKKILEILELAQKKQK